MSTLIGIQYMGSLSFGFVRTINSELVMTESLIYLQPLVLLNNLPFFF